MKVQFNRPAVIAGKQYAKGVHEVPNADAKDDWYFKVLEKDGALAAIKAAPAPTKAELKAAEEAEAAAKKAAEEAELEAQIAAEEAEKKAAEEAAKENS